MKKIGKYPFLITSAQVEYVVNHAIKGNHRPFNHFFEKTYTALLPKLTTLIKSEEEVKEVFMTAMQRFWECFIIDKKTLPDNSVVYIYVMCKNNWLLEQKNDQKKIMYNDQIYHKKEQIYGLDEHVFGNPKIETEDQLLKHKALTIALEALSPKCKNLIEANLDPEVRLKSLQQELGYLNYQALVQAKYNCKKKLIKIAYKVFGELKKNDTVNK